MHLADEAMYAAKEKGKNSFQVYKPNSSATNGSGAGNSYLRPPQFPLATGDA
jgi:hypothetical protein